MTSIYFRFGARLLILKYEIVSLSSSQHIVPMGYITLVMERAWTQFIF